MGQDNLNLENHTLFVIRLVQAVTLTCDKPLLMDELHVDLLLSCSVNSVFFSNDLPFVMILKISHVSHTALRLYNLFIFTAYSHIDMLV